MSNPVINGGVAPLEDIIPVLEECGLELLCRDQGFVRCPGQHLHTKANAESDCKAFNNDGIPRLYCLHQSCTYEISEANTRLYDHSQPAKASKNTQVRSRGSARAKQEQLRKWAATLLPTILADYSWPVAGLPAASPENLTGVREEEHWRYLIDYLFEPDDLVWIGRDEKDTGSPNHCWRFRTMMKWLDCEKCPGPFTCPSTFKAGTYSRSASSILTTKYLVVESDTLSRDDMAAVFHWLELEAKMPVRAVVDTGNRSLHGWFDYPPPDEIPNLKVVLTALGCDPAMFKSSQPCRLPGALRNGRYQRLLYLNHKP